MRPKVRAEREADLQRALAAEEEEARRALARSGVVDEYRPLLVQTIERNWIRPPSARAGLECTLYVTQAPGGSVVDVKLGACNGDQAVRESITTAVYSCLAAAGAARSARLRAPPRNRVQADGVANRCSRRFERSSVRAHVLALLASAALLLRRRAEPRAAAPRHHAGRARRCADRRRAVRRPGRGRRDRRRGRDRQRPAHERAFRAARAARHGRAPDRAAREIRFEDWRLLQVRLHRRRPRRARRRRLAVSFELLQRAHRRRAAQPSGCRSTERGLRATAHRIADLVFERLTGIPGAFSTRIAYVAVDGRPPAQRYRLIVADADGYNPRTITRVARTDHVAARGRPTARTSPTCRSRARSSAIYVQRLATGRAPARVGPCRHQRCAGLVAGRPQAGAHAVARRQPRHLHARP
ncbi:MAG: hypothetical protein MZW92_34040, partial [Comamonadaceae bacterium]|nr:hypothetical protein [Comamonadaceae bacterium]